MDSDFIGSSIGKDGVLYGTIDNIYGPGPDIKTKLQFLKYIINIKTGLGMGANLIEAFMKDPTLNIKTFTYKTTDTIWVIGGYRDYRMYNTIVKKGYIINNDTITIK